MLRTIIFKIALGTYFILWSPILLVGLISRRTCAFCVYTCSAGVLTVARIFAGIKYQVHFPESEDSDIPLAPNENNRLDGKSIVAAKHMSILEISVIAKTIPNTFFIVKRELMWIPVYGWAFARMGAEPVNRRRGSTDMNKLTNSIAAKILKGRTLALFPEGTRAKPGQKIPLKRGLLLLAYKLKLPILPVGTDAGLYWPKRGRIRPGTAHVYFEPLLPCNASLDEIADAINRHSA